MDGPWCHCAKWNKSDRETNTVWFHFYVESGKTKNSNWGKNELVDTDNRLTVYRSGDGECVKMVKKYKLPVIR